MLRQSSHQLSAGLVGLLRRSGQQVQQQGVPVIAGSWTGALSGPTPAVFINHLTSQRSAQRGGVSLLTNYKQLSKFKLSSLVVLTAGAGFVAGSGEAIDWAGLAWTSLGTFGAAACANTLNQLYEVSNDGLMSRTCNRPLPAGRLSRGHAAAFAVTAAAAGLSLLYYKCNPLTAALGATNIALYAGVYTPLKQLSIANTWVGAVVGAIPPLMGWAAASGSLEPGSAVLAAALFYWQLPHFLALAWLCKADYIRGGFRMISAVDLTGRRTAAAALRNALYLLPLGAAAHWAGLTSEPFAWEAAGLAAMMIVPATQFLASPSQPSARKLFRSSLLYLPLLILGMAVHRLPNDHTLTWEAVQHKVESMVAGAPSEGVLPFLRTAIEQSGAAASRLLGFSQAAITEMRCPSTVTADSVDGEELEGAGEAQVVVVVAGSKGAGVDDANSSGVEGAGQSASAQPTGLGAWLPSRANRSSSNSSSSSAA